MSLKLHHTHPWNLSLGEARALQGELQSFVSIQPLALNDVKTIAGVDASFRNGQMRAASAVLNFSSQETFEQAAFHTSVSFPYLPGLLSFREAPAILEALARLNSLPDVLLVDGHGRAHPRRFGLACHLGVLLDIPTIGCAKSNLVGEMDPLERVAGSTSAVRLEGEVLGLAVRTRTGVRPVYISIGHRVDLVSAVEIVLACCRGYRLPEPSRAAHRLSLQA